MATYNPPKKNTAYIMYVGLKDQADGNAFKASPTLAAGDFKVSKDGGSLANLATLPTVTPASGKMVKISLSATEMNADNVTVVCSDASGAEWADLMINLQTVANQFDDLDATIDALNDPTAAAIADAVLDETLSGHTTAGTLGKAVADVESDVTDVLADTNELQGNQGNWLTATGFSTHNAAAVWAVATRVLTAGTNLNDISTADVAAELATYDGPTKAELDSGLAGLNDPTAAAIADAVADELLAGHTTPGSLAQAITDILADTGELQTNQGNWLTATGFSTHSAADVQALLNDLDASETAAAVWDARQHRGGFR
jgi:DNA-binding transcriptional ArsR family regulator